jgi:DNA-binding NtrC family response regulator
MALLDKALRDEGFLLMRTPVKTGGDNPALIASRCALLDGGSFALDGEFQATVVQADGETRSARYVELPLGPTADAPTLGLIVTQLHHRNHHSGDPSRGLRAAEVACALEACRTRAHLAAQSSPRIAPPEDRGAPRRAPTREEIEGALRANDGRVASAARALGMHRNQLRRWLTTNQVEPRAFSSNPDALGDDD